MIDEDFFALDTNVIIYAEGYDGDDKCARAKSLISAIDPLRLVLPAQVLGEAFVVLLRKHGMKRHEAQAAIRSWQSAARMYAASEETFTAAFDLAATHKLQFWDALILATAAAARCRLLLSEDLQDGFVFRGCTVANPFQPVLHPLLKDALEH